jgi:hypothetical protein
MESQLEFFGNPSFGQRSLGARIEAIDGEESLDVDDRAVTKDKFMQTQKVVSIQCVESMQISPIESSRFDIPLCKMVYIHWTPTSSV